MTDVGHRFPPGSETLREFFPDDELVAFVRETYTDAMADRVAELCAADPLSMTGFVTALRRSLTAEIDRSVHHA